VSRRLTNEGVVPPVLRWRLQRQKSVKDGSLNKVDMSTFDRTGQRRRQPMRLTVGMIEGGVAWRGLMCSKMAVNNRPVMRGTDISGVQVLRGEQQQPGDRKRQQAAHNRLASPRQLHLGIMAGMRPDGQQTAR
jgi:hypothetical protein